MGTLCIRGFSQITLGRTCCVIGCESAFSYAGPSAWNALSEELRAIADEAEYRKQLKTHFLLQLLMLGDFWFSIYVLWSNVTHLCSLCTINPQIITCVAIIERKRVLEQVCCTSDLSVGLCVCLVGEFVERRLIISAKWTEWTARYIVMLFSFCPSVCEHSLFRSKYLENGLR